MNDQYNMRYLFFIIFSIFTNFVDAKDIKSFNEIKREFKQDGDMSRISYIFSRCASLSLVNASLVSRGGDEKTSSQFQKSAVQYMELSDLVEQDIDKNRKVARSDKDRAKSIGISITEISNLYQARLNSNYARTGNYIIEDENIKEEIEKCRDPNKLVEWILGR